MLFAVVPQSCGGVPGLGMPETIPPLCIGPNNPSQRDWPGSKAGLELIWVVTPLDQCAPNASPWVHQDKLPLAQTLLLPRCLASPPELTQAEMVFRYALVRIKPRCRSCVIISCWLADGFWKRVSKFLSLLVPELTDSLAKNPGEL